MKMIAMVSMLVSLLFAAGCTQSVRYSDDEIKDFPPHIQDHIRKNQVVVGMTRIQVRYSWGGPNAVQVLKPSDDGKERVEWVYEKMKFFKTRIVFTDNKLTEIVSNEPGFSR